MWLLSMTLMYDSHFNADTLSIAEGNKCQRYLKIPPVSPDSGAMKQFMFLKIQLQQFHAGALFFASGRFGGVPLALLFL